LGAGQLPERPLSTFLTSFIDVREFDAGNARAVNGEEATASRQSAVLKCDGGLWPVHARSLNVKRVAAARLLAVANRCIADGLVRGIWRADNDKGLSVSAAAVGKGGWLS
jgi:hypothetical protein